MSNFQKREMKYQWMIFTLSVVTTALMGCGKDELGALDQISVLNLEEASAKINVCTTPSSEFRSRQKFIFIVDKSGSNQFQSQVPGNPGTDDSGTRRYGGIEAFLDSITDDEDLYYSLINFSDGADVRENFQQDKESFERTVVCDHYESNPACGLPGEPVDAGYTNYSAALAELETMIQADIDRAQANAINDGELWSSSYVVFFVSDGFPTIDGDILDLNDPNDQLRYEALRNSIRSTILGLKAKEDQFQEYVDFIQFNTVYYHTPGFFNAAPDALLRDMSRTWGGGNHLVQNDGQGIDFTQFLIPDRQVKFVMKELFVTNAELVWTPDGQLVRDRDADGLIDSLETGTCVDGRPAIENPDCDGNYIRDGLEYAVFGQAMNNANDGTVFQPGCEGYLEFDLSTPDPFDQYMRDLDNDGFNDCEEQYTIGSSITRFDSNFDLIPDSLAFQAGVSINPGINDGLADPDQDGLISRAEVKYNTPINVPNDQIVNLKPYKYSIGRPEDLGDQTCYEVRVDNIPTSGSRNRIDLYFIEGSAGVGRNVKVRRASKAVKRGGSVTFSNSEIN